MQQKLSSVVDISSCSGRASKRNIYSKNVLPVLNIIDYSLCVRVGFSIELYPPQ